MNIERNIGDMSWTSSEGSVVGPWHPTTYWRPLPDITAYELAQAVPVLIFMASHYGLDIDFALKSLPIEVSRHFSTQPPE